MVQNSSFGRAEMRFVQTVGGIRTMVPQNLGLGRVEATMCYGQYHFLAMTRPKKCPRSAIDFYPFHDMNLKIPRKTKSGYINIAILKTHFCGPPKCKNSIKCCARSHLGILKYKNSVMQPYRFVKQFWGS